VIIILTVINLERYLKNRDDMHIGKSQVKLKEKHRKSLSEVSQTKAFLELGSKSKYRVWRNEDRAKVEERKKEVKSRKKRERDGL